MTVTEILVSMPFAIVGGSLVGGLVWVRFVKPIQLNNHERERRHFGLPAKRKLPEDNKEKVKVN